MEINAERLSMLSARPLLKGNHIENADAEMCVMEAVAYVAGEPWSDRPRCASLICTNVLQMSAAEVLGRMCEVGRS